MSRGVFLLVSYPLHPLPLCLSSFHSFNISSPALQNNPELATREVAHSHIANVPIKFAKRESVTTATEAKRNTIDAVNMNVDTSSEGVTMTFVETLDDEEVEEEEER